MLIPLGFPITRAMSAIPPLFNCHFLAISAIFHPDGFCLSNHPMFRSHVITRSLAALCLRPSASPHPGILNVLLKTNVKPQFDKAVTRQSIALFRLFFALESAFMFP
jgi:hypothetical protein